MSDSEPPARGSSVTGLNVLVVEDETLISFLVEDMLQELGCREVWHAGGIAEAIALVERHRPDLALLDVNLGSEMVFPVADRLEQAGIPFLFATGYGRGGMPVRWNGRPVIQKPFAIEALERAIGAALRA